MKKIFFTATIITTLTIATIVLAQEVVRNPATVVPSGQVVIVPDQAIDNSPALERMIFIHYRDGHTKAIKPGGGSATCYGFLSQGAKLKTTENLVIHPDLNASAILNGASEWDSHTLTPLFGNYTIDSSANWDGNAPDGRNEFSFGNYPQTGVIAVTVVWGYFSGSVNTREIKEFDVMFDTDFVWGDATTNPALMDLQNIATHEIGHGAGLADVYNNSCNLVTMYGYSTEGEISKRTLETADIVGLTKLYGN